MKKDLTDTDRLIIKTFVDQYVLDKLAGNVDDQGNTVRYEMNPFSLAKRLEDKAPAKDLRFGYEHFVLLLSYDLTPLVNCQILESTDYAHPIYRSVRLSKLAVAMFLQNGKEGIEQIFQDWKERFGVAD